MARFNVQGRIIACLDFDEMVEANTQEEAYELVMEELNTEYDLHSFTAYDTQEVDIVEDA